MGSLKDEMKGVREDHQPSERKDDGGLPSSSDGSGAPEGLQTNTAPESTTQGGHQPKLHMEGKAEPPSEDRVLSVGVCDSTDQSDSIGVNDWAQTKSGPLTGGKPEADKAATTLPNDDENVGIEKEILVPVPSTPNLSDPFSPAPFGQHHMRTQVSLEVVQCHSAATSPMTPPEGGHSSFFFPNSSQIPPSKDAELQVGQQVEFCSVATSPMTPKTPSTTAFPALIGSEAVHGGGEAGKAAGHSESCKPGSSPETTGPAEAESEITAALDMATSKNPTEVLGPSSAGSSDTRLMDLQATPEESSHQSKQQRMGSMDQDITILVTHHGNTEGEESERAESPLCPVDPEMVKIDECEESEEKESGDGKDRSSSDSPQGEIKTEETIAPQTKATESKDVEPKDTSVPKPAVPESPAPFGCHNIRTQVSLEVVQCQSVATSPMTPPEGDSAFYFPSSLGGHATATAATETKDVELQVGQQVEFRSVATAPMTPRTPTVVYFPEVMKGASVEEKIVEVEEEEKAEEESTEEAERKKEEEGEVSAGKEKEAGEEEGEVSAGKEKEAGEEVKGEERGEEKGEEPVQEVSWDEKGMTWEVYGAVVEVAVLGSAIQKHLEKQVMKQKKQPSLPPPPPLNPSSAPPPAEPAQGCSGSGKGRAGKRGDGKASRRRRNPFRLLMENMQQPHCCSRAHTTE